MAAISPDSGSAAGEVELTTRTVAWKVHWWVLGITGLPCLGFAAFMLASALADSSAMAVGVLIYGIILAGLWGLFAAAASALFAGLRRFGGGAVLLGYFVALVPIGLVVARFTG